MDVKRNESFVFYLQREDEASSSVTHDSNGFYPIEGEQEVAHACKMVIYYPAFSDNRTGILGTLYCTTLRILFVPATGVKSEDAEFPTSRVLTSFKYETPLLNICQVQYAPTADSKKLKPLTTFIQYLDQVTFIKIYCKDFRIFTFDFKSSEGHRALLNAMLRYAFPQKLNNIVSVYRLFSLNRNQQSTSVPNDDVPSFDSKPHWEAELRRTGAIAFAWRVTHVNTGHRYVEGYPEYFVVPTSWLDNQISISCSNWTNRRIPVWCWSSADGCALVRCSTFNTVSEVTDRQWQEVENAIAETHPRRRAPILVESEINCQDVATAYEALRKLCSADTGSVFWQADTRWLTEMEVTGWPALVTKCLSITANVTTIISEAKLSVVFREPGNSDIACLVSSLVQLCLDPYFRTVPGFAVLLQKEWVALSHSFGVRLFGLAWESRNDDGVAPIFLLFLDCVYQLMQQHPTKFAFSGHFLIALWDLALTGLTRTFLFNNLRETSNFSGGTMRSAWSLDMHFTPSYRHLFINPLYSYVHGLERLAGMDSPKKSMAHSGKFENGNRNLHTVHHQRITNGTFSEMMVLTPKPSITAYCFWDDCYLRWSAPAQTLRGGRIQGDLQVFSILAEISHQLNELRYLRDQHELERSKFGQQLRHYRVPSIHLSTTALDRMTSAFPYGWDTIPIPDYSYILPLRNDKQQCPSTPRSALDISSLNLSSETTSEKLNRGQDTGNDWPSKTRKKNKSVLERPIADPMVNELRSKLQRTSVKAHPPADNVRKYSSGTLV